MNYTPAFFYLVLILSLSEGNSQNLKKIAWSQSGLVTSFTDENGKKSSPEDKIPLITFNFNKKNTNII